MGLVPMRYPKRECEVHADPKLLMDHGDDTVSTQSSAQGNLGGNSVAPSVNQPGSGPSSGRKRANSGVQIDVDDMSTAQSFRSSVLQQQASWPTLLSSRSSFDFNATARDGESPRDGERGNEGSQVPGKGSSNRPSARDDPSQKQHQQFDYFPGGPSYHNQQISHQQQSKQFVPAAPTLRGPIQSSSPTKTLHRTDSLNASKRRLGSQSAGGLPKLQPLQYPTQVNGNQTGALSQQTTRGRLSPITQRRSGNNGTARPSSRSKSPGRTQKSTNALPQGEEEDADIMALVAMIKKAKELEDRDVHMGVSDRGERAESRVGELLGKWKAISRF